MAGLEKMYMQAYSKEDYASSHKVGDKFTLQVNPESYKVSWLVDHDTTQAAGTGGTSLHFNKILPPDLSFDVLFDSSGVLTGGPGGGDVTAQLTAFKDSMLSYNGSVHQSNFVKVHWGTLTFKGKIISMDVAFKLFRPDGTPIRAVASLGMKGSTEDNLQQAMDDKQSPDITHRRVFMAGDRLPLLTGTIYGNGAYYIEVAGFNRLNSFRKIAQGTTLGFPPLQ